MCQRTIPRGPMEILKEYVEREEVTEEQAHLGGDENELYECVNAAVNCNRTRRIRPGRT